MAQATNSVDSQLKNYMTGIINHGELRKTRAGDAISISFPQRFTHDMRMGFPIPTAKSVPMALVAGELLWFLSGKTDLHSLREYQFGVDDGRHTIWSDDFKRYSEGCIKVLKDSSLDEGLIESITNSISTQEDLGLVYGAQWRSFAGMEDSCDQIVNLIEGIKTNPASRYHVVSAWNPVDVQAEALALPPCHMYFQVYASEGKYMDLMWHQRSVDTFLGLPFNITSYGLLLEILAAMTGYTPRHLVGTFGDMHLYTNEVDAATEYVGSATYKAPELQIGKLDVSTLDKVLALKGKDFKDILVGYENSGVISAPLSVG